MGINNYIHTMPLIMLNCLFWTIIIEMGMALLLKVKDKKDLLNIFLVNCLTNPLIVITTMLIQIYHGSHYERIFELPLELIVWIIEGFIYSKYLKYKKINPYLLSIILNLSSYLIGFIINAIIW